MAYLNQLDTLLGGLRAGVYDPQDALSGLMELQQARKDRRLERRQTAQAAQQDALSSLTGLAYSSASEGDPLSSLTMNPEFSTAASTLGLPLGQAKRAVKQMGYYGPGGVSSLNPMLDPEDEGAILSDFYAAIQEGADLTAAREKVQNTASQAYDPATYSILRPQIDELLNKTFTAMNKSY